MHQPQVPLLPYASERVLVLGASGFVGQALVQQLQVAGAALHLAGRDMEESKGVPDAVALGAQVHQADICDTEGIRALLAEVGPAVTFNATGYGIDRSEKDRVVGARVNAEAVEGLANAVAHHRDKAWRGYALVHCGSQLEYGPIGGRLPESADPRPDTWYGETKLDGTRRMQRVAQATGVPMVVGRAFTLYGPGEHPGRLLPTLLTAMDTNDVISLSAGTQRRDFVFVEDFAEGLARLGSAPAEEGLADIVNIATGRLTPVRTFAETAARILGIRADRLRFGDLPVRSREELGHEEVRVEKLRNLTGWTPSVSIEEGIELTRQWTRVKSGDISEP